MRRTLVFGAIGTVVVLIVLVGTIVGLRWRGPRANASVGQGSARESDQAAAGSHAGLPEVAEGLPPAPHMLLTPDELPQVVRAYQRILSDVDRSSFDATAKAARLTGGAAEAFSLVRDRIATEVYPGVLRGPDGTLSASAGNDLDKALLLGALLAAQKRQVRYAHCSLDGARAQEIVDSMFLPSKPAEPIDLDAALKTALTAEGISSARVGQLVEARVASRQALDLAVRRTAENDLGVVRAALAKASVVPRPAFDRAALLSEARSHYWVQVESQGDWQDLDPSFPQAQPGQSFCSASDGWTEVPSDLYQSVIFRVRNESVEKGAPTFSVVLERQLPSAELHGQPILLINFAAPTGSPLGTDMGAARRFVPVLVVGDSLFGGEEFQPVPGAGDARDVLGGNELLGGESPAGPVLVAQYLELELIAPGRKVSVRRTLFDTVDSASRARSDFSAPSDSSLLAAALVQPHAIVISSGRLNRIRAGEAVLRRLDPDRFGRVFRGPAGKPTDEMLRDLVSLEHLALLAYAELFSAVSDDALGGRWRDAYANARVYRDRPSITIADRVLRRSHDGRGLTLALSLDMRENDVRVVPRTTDHVDEAFWLNLHYGLIAGALERHLLAYAPFDREGAAPNPDALSTTAVFELARSSGVGVRAAAGPNASDLLRREFAATGGDRVATEVSGVTAAIFPERPVRFRDEDRFGLWTVDLASGHAVPLLDTGLHQDLAEMDRLNTQYFNLAKNCIAKFGVKNPLCDELIGMFTHWNSALREYFRVWDLLENTVIKAAF